jgi:predicted cupin superfamily sugar epimerase
VNGTRSCVTSIYYLLERHQMSRWHVVDADEIWHFYRGAALELYAYETSSRQLVPQRLSQSNPAAVIRRGVWQAARSHGDFSLVGCSVAPGFEFADFQFVRDLPDHRPHFQSVLTGLADLL